MKQLRSERGHGAVTCATTFAIVGTVLLAIGLGNDSNGLSVAGAIVVGIGSVVGFNGPHLWLRSVYRRLDKVDPEDNEAMPEKRIRIQL
jgi:hypothetical protein